MLKQLEQHDTRDTKTQKVNGKLIPLYRDWDESQKEPKMVYASFCEPFSKKGAHLHVRREDNFVCIKGKVVFVVKEDGVYKEYILRDINPHVLKVPEGIPSAHINIGLDDAIVVNCASTSWKPDDQDNLDIEFNDYDWSKWIPVCQKELAKLKFQLTDDRKSYLENQFEEFKKLIGKTK